MFGLALWGRMRASSMRNKVCQIRLTYRPDQPDDKLSRFWYEFLIFKNYLHWYDNYGNLIQQKVHQNQL